MMPTLTDSTTGDDQFLVNRALMGSCRMHCHSQGLGWMATSATPCRPIGCWRYSAWTCTITLYMQRLVCMAVCTHAFLKRHPFPQRLGLTTCFLDSLIMRCRAAAVDGNETLRPTIMVGNLLLALCIPTYMGARCGDPGVCEVNKLVHSFVRVLDCNPLVICAMHQAIRIAIHRLST